MPKIDLPGGYFVRIEGNYYDLVKFYNNQPRKIAEDDIRNGNFLDFGIGGIGPDVTFYKTYVNNFVLLAVRHGTERDFVYGYAIFNDKVYRSPRYKDNGNGGFVGIRVTHNELSTYPNGGYGFDINGVGSGSLSFQFATQTWICINAINSTCSGSTYILPAL